MFVTRGKKKSRQIKRGDKHCAAQLVHIHVRSQNFLYYIVHCMLCVLKNQHIERSACDAHVVIDQDQALYCAGGANYKHQQ